MINSVISSVICVENSSVGVFFESISIDRIIYIYEILTLLSEKLLSGFLDSIFIDMINYVNELFTNLVKRLLDSLFDDFKSDVMDLLIYFLKK